MIGARVPERRELRIVIPDRAQDAEPFNDVVRHEIGRGIVGAAVMGVVVALAALDVIGEGLRHIR